MIISYIEIKSQSIKIFICLEFFGKINFFSQSHTSRIHTYSFNDIASFKKKQINIYISIAVDSGRHIHGTINNIFIFVFISFVISYKCIQAITKSKRQAAWFSIIYNNSGYLMLQIMQQEITMYI